MSRSYLVNVKIPERQYRRADLGNLVVRAKGTTHAVELEVISGGGAFGFEAGTILRIDLPLDPDSRFAAVQDILSKWAPA